MTLTSGILKQGTFPTTAGAIYVAATETFISNFTVYSTMAGTNTLIVWIRKSSDAKVRYRQFSLTANQSAQLVDAKAIVLAAGDSIEAQTTTATSTETVFTMCGVQRT